MKRIEWEQYFVALSKITAMRSKDPNTKVGAIIVNDRNRILSLGYNGMPNGDDSFPWSREAENEKDKKYPYVIHAEINAVLNASTDLRGTTMYTTLFPCSNCAKFIVQTGITKICYISNFYAGTEDHEISEFILKKGNVAMQQVKDIEITLN